MARRRKRPRLTAEEVAAALLGNARLDELLRLIRGINPSRLELPPQERRARYQLKAQLQSLVLRQHSTAMEIFPTREPGVIAIRRRGARGDAGHAVIAHLDADVRPLVEDRLRLDDRGRKW